MNGKLHMHLGIFAIWWNIIQRDQNGLREKRLYAPLNFEKY